MLDVSVGPNSAFIYWTIVIAEQIKVLGVTLYTDYSTERMFLIDKYVNPIYELFLKND